MTSPLSAVAAALEAHRHDTVELLQALVRTPSTNPPGDTREVASIVQRYLDGAGIATELVGVDDDRPCVVARVGAQEGPVLGFNSHLDTVGVGEASDWPPGGPFCGRIDGGSVWGRGAGDAKASVAAMCVAAAVLNGIGEQWSGGVLLALVSEEETGGSNGTGFLLDAGLGDADAWVVGELTRNQVAIAERGIVWIELETIGRAAHASTPERGVSAIDGMLELLQRIRTEVAPGLIKATHPLTPPGSLNIGLLRGGTQPNVVADRCVAVLDCRLVPGQDPSALEAELRALVADHARRDRSADARMRTLLAGSPFETDAEAPVVVAARAACRAAGLADDVVGFDQTCDARFYAERGIPTIVFGPGDPAVAHTSREHVAVADLEAAVRVYANLAVEYLGRDRSPLAPAGAATR